MELCDNVGIFHCSQKAKTKTKGCDTLIKTVSAIGLDGANKLLFKPCIKVQTAGPSCSKHR